MDSNLIKSEFYQFEKLFFNNNLIENNNNFYFLLNNKEIEHLFYKFLENNPLKTNEIDKLFKRDINKLTELLEKKKTNFSGFTYINSEFNVLSAYLLLFLIKTFSTKLKLKKHNYDFSFSSEKELLFDRNDFINVFLEFLFKFFIFNEIKSKIYFSFSRENLRKFIFRFIELCAKENLILIQDFKMHNRSFKLLQLIPVTVPCAFHIVFYTEAFNSYIRSENEFYAYNSHFSSIVEITKQAKYNTSRFKIPTEQVKKLLERPIYIDRNFLKKAFKFLLEEQGYNICTNLIEKAENLLKKIEKFIIEKDLDSLRWYHSKLSKVLTLIRVETVLSMNFDNIKLYLPFMFCFRGRVYELSDLSFTFYKEFRFCTYSGLYENESETFHPINTHILITIKNQFYLFKNFEWFEQLSEIRKYACIWIFISLGALKKTELGEKIHISEFILKGLELQKKKNYSLFKDVYEKIEFNYMLNLIDELTKNDKKLKKWIFWKDAPASCFQHQLLILGAKNDDSYKICNLDSVDTWYDPYTFLINNFFEKNCDKITKNLHAKSNLMLTKSKYFEIFSRKRLKKIFMTESYGAGQKKLSFFFTLDLNFNNYSKEEENAIMLIWEKFFDYISNENPLFKEKSKQIITYFTKNNIKSITNPDQTIVDYSCFEIQITQSEIYIKKKRHTIQSRNITKVPDQGQFKTSIRANFVHTQDAILARKYILITKMWSIHDCFSIDFLNITYMVALINELMNGEFYDLKINTDKKKTIYSIFLIL